MRAMPVSLDKCKDDCSDFLVFPQPPRRNPKPAINHTQTRCALRDLVPEFKVTSGAEIEHSIADIADSGWYTAIADKCNPCGIGPLLRVRYFTGAERLHDGLLYVS